MAKNQELSEVSRHLTNSDKDNVSVSGNVTFTGANVVINTELHVAAKLSVNSTVANIGNLGLIANGSLGSDTNVLKSNGSATYWGTVTGGPGGEPGGANTYVQFNDSTTFGGSDAFTFDKVTNNVFVANTVNVGTATINSTFFSQKANSADYIGSLIAANVVSNAQLSANLADYQTEAGLADNVATLTANSTNFVGSVSAANVVSNAQLSANLESYQTEAGLSTNVATLTANNTSFVGSTSAANVVSNAQLSANLANYALTTDLDAYQTEAGLATNVAILTANNTSFVGSVSAANVVSNAQLSANLGNYQTTAGLATNVQTLTANSANYVGTLIAANVVSNAQLSANLGNYQTTAGLATNVATLTANNANNLGTVAASNYVVNTDSRTLSGNLTFSGANVTFTGANHTFTGTNASFSNVNISTSLGIAAKLSVNSTVVNVGNLGLIANGALGSAGWGLKSNGSATYWEAITASATPGGADKQVQFNDATTMNATAGFTFDKSTNNVVIANTATVGGIVTINSTAVNVATTKLIANGAGGANGWVLLSNGTSVYWREGTGFGIKAIDVPSPVNTDKITFFWVNTAITILELRTVVRGSSPSVTHTWYFGADRTGASNTVIQSGIQTSNVTQGNSLTSFACSSVTANTFIWFDVTATSGTVSEFHVTMRYI